MKAHLALLVSVAAAQDLGAVTVFVDKFTDGILDPAKAFLGPVKDGGHVIANTAPGCWGPMITPSLKGGHEVTVPVAVAGAEVGDAVMIRIKDITITSSATASGNDYWVRTISTARGSRAPSPSRRRAPRARRCCRTTA